MTSVSDKPASTSAVEEPVTESAQEEAPQVKSKQKMWATAAPTEMSPKAVSLASIMAEEETKAKLDQEQKEAERVREQEEMELRLVFEASMAEANTKMVPDSTTVKPASAAADLDQDMKLAIALSLQATQPDNQVAAASRMEGPQEAASGVASAPDSTGFTEEEEEQIAKALREADKAQVDDSLSLALKLQEEEDRWFTSPKKRASSSDSHVRTITRQELWQEQAKATSNLKTPHDYYHDDDEECIQDHADAGFRMNPATPSKEWSRLDRATIVGPNQELRTKHDVELASRANARRLGLDDDDAPRFVGNKAYNAFKQSMKRSTHKGVAAHGHGRATADTDKTKQGGMDSRVRTQIVKAINNGLIEVCNGVVKEGKEAIVYHANEGAESGGYDVAIKVFKRIQEFKERYSYVDGDPRYLGRKFNNASSREQLEIWAEKEFRNLTRANRGGVPVPTPLLQKENILFMRFLGEDGWPSPQLKELSLKKGSKRWKTLYSQTMDAVRRLYHKGHLVHGDLSEYNVQVCPSRLVENRNVENDGDDNAVQIVLIDLGQAVDVRHPSSLELLQRDILRVKQFFDKMGVKTKSTQEAETFVLSSWEDEENDGTKRRD